MKSSDCTRLVKIWTLATVFFVLPLGERQLFAKNQGIPFISNFLEDVKENSRTIESIRSASRAQVLGQDLELTQFDLSNTLTATMTDDQSPATNPFAPDQLQTYTLGASFKKMFETGFETSLNVTFIDNRINFPTNPEVSYLAPEVNLGFKMDLMRDLFGSRNSYKAERLNQSKAQLELQSRFNVKAQLASSLLSLAQVLEKEDEIKLQDNLCKRVNVQTKKLSQKNRRGSISKREYLLSRKELNTCRINLDSLRKTLTELIQNFNVRFNIKYSRYKDVSVDLYFKNIEKLYMQFKSTTDISLENNDLELRALSLQVDSLKSQLNETAGNALPRLDLEVKVGTSGLDSEFSVATEQLTGFDNPYLFVSVTTDLPLGTRRNEIQKQISYNQLESSKRSYAQRRAEKYSRLETLSSSLEKDFKVYELQINNMQLSRQIFNEAQKDFNNGRIDFFTLTEFQKALIQNQKELARLRAQIVINAVEYLDLFQFFDKYAGKVS